MARRVHHFVTGSDPQEPARTWTVVASQRKCLHTGIPAVTKSSRGLTPSAPVRFGTRLTAGRRGLDSTLGPSDHRRMTRIVQSIEIARSPEDVFAYLDDLERHGEWQSQIVSSRRETEGATRVGSRATDVRKVPGGKQAITYEVTEHDPPRRVVFNGVNGPVRPVGSVTVEPAGEGRSKVTLELELRGHGPLGLLLAPLARSQARKQVPLDQQKLKERLESGA